MKLQLIVHPRTQQILSASVSRGKRHDLTIFKRSNVRPHRETEILADAAYNGIKREHTCSRTPQKSSKHHPLTAEQRTSNRQLARERLVVEHVIRRIKIFRIFKETYRHRRRRVRLRLTLIAALCNLMRRLPI